MKVCSKCNEEKPLDEFHKQKRGKYGRRSQCKVCARAYQESRTDDRLRYNNEYYTSHKDVICAQMRAYRRTPEGKASLKRSSGKRRDFGYEPLNDSFDSCEYHHLHLNNNHAAGVHIPVELHKSLHHNSFTGANMHAMNVIALLYLASEHSKQ